MRTAVSASGYNCFANPVRADVMIDGRKVAGAAQRRTRAGLLQQGSVQYVDLGNGLAGRFAQALSVNCSERKIADDVLKRGAELAEQKYRNRCVVAQALSGPARCRSLSSRKIYECDALTRNKPLLYSRTVEVFARSGQSRSGIATSASLLGPLARLAKLVQPH